MVRHTQGGKGSDPEAANPSLLLADALEELYLVLRRYPLKSRIEGCPCCVGDEDQAQIHSKSLRALTDEDLERYASDALLTWGDVDDFRHFLPRLLELLTGHPYNTFYTEIVLSKLAYAHWWEWPERERVAIESVLWLRWTAGLELDPQEFDADAWLCGVALAGVEISEYVDAWKSGTTPTTFAHIAEFLEWNRDLLSQGRLRNAFYPEDPAEYEGHPAEDVAREMRQWLSAYMADPEFQTRLAAWYQGPRWGRAPS